MNSLFALLMFAAMLAVAASLVIGLFFMARGRESDAAKSQKMMRARVVLQGAAVILFLLAVVLVT